MATLPVLLHEVAVVRGFAAATSPWSDIEAPLMSFSVFVKTKAQRKKSTLFPHPLDCTRDMQFQERYLQAIVEDPVVAVAGTTTNN